MLDQLEITIQHKTAAGWPVVVELNAVNRLPRRVTGLIPLKSDPKTTLLAIADPLAYGIALGKMVFSDKTINRPVDDEKASQFPEGPTARDLFGDALGLGGERVHVLLVVEDSELQTLKWELLAGPSDEGWIDLARYQRTPFSRYLPGVSRRHYPPIGSRDQRALIVWANPPAGSEYARFNEADETGRTPYSRLRAALGPVPTDVIGVDVPDALGPPTLAQLTRQLSRQKYTLLHIVAHGVFSRDEQEPVVILRDNENPERLKRFSGTQILAQLRNVTHLPYLVFLTACESAQRSEANPFGDLANQLMTGLGIPAVIAMTDEVSIATANALAQAFYPLLLEERFVDIALTGARAGIARFDIAVPALYSRLGTRALFADTVERPLTAAEKAFGIERALNLFAERAPALVPALQAAADTVVQVGLLAAEALDDDDRGREAAALKVIEKLVDDVLGRPFAALALDQAVDDYDARCPFPGSRPFSEADAAFFFGRDAEIAAAQARLQATACVVVAGASGAGKRSLVWAGLVPALRAAAPDLAVHRVVLAGDPAATLRTALAAPPDVLVVEQFERLLTGATPPAEVTELCRQLLAPPAGCRVILLLRGDGLAALEAYPELAPALAASQLFLAPLSAPALRDAGERQAGRVGLSFEAGLAHVIASAVAGEAAAMSVWSETLARLWQQRRGPWLTTAGYHDNGGVAGAVVDLAEAALAGLTPAETAAAGEICLRLVLPAADGSGRSAPDRRVAGLDELAAPPDLLDKLVAGRLLVVNAGASPATVELAHTILLRDWPRLADWLHADPVLVRARNELSPAAARWAGGGPAAEEFLLRGGALAAAAGLLTRAPERFSDNEKAFVAASSAAAAAAAVRRRTAARNRAAMTGFVASALTYGPAAIVVWSGIIENDLGLLLYLAVNQALYGGAFGLLFSLLLDPALLRQWPRADRGSWLRAALTGMIPLALLNFLERLVISGNLLADVGALLGAAAAGAVWGGVTATAAFWLLGRKQNWPLLGAAALVAGLIHTAAVILLSVMRVEPDWWRLLVAGTALPLGLLLAGRLNTSE